MEQVPEDNIDLDLYFLKNYYNSIKIHLEKDPEVRKEFISECAGRISKLFVDNSLDDISSYGKSEFEIIASLQIKTEVYAQRFEALIDLFTTPDVNVPLLYSTCEHFGSFFSSLRRVDIHFLFDKKTTLVQKLNLEIDIQLMKAATFVSQEVIDNMKRLVLNLGDPGFGSDDSDLPPEGPKDGGRCVDPFSKEWSKVDTTPKIKRVEIRKLVLEA